MSHCVSACYDVKAVDERPYMEAVVERTNSIPHWCYPQFDEAFALAERITWHQDEPYGSTSIFAQWCVFEEARRAGLKVMLDGQGADEQFAGYHGCFPYHFANLIRQRRFATLLRAMAERHAWHNVSFWEQAQSFLMPLAAAMAGALVAPRAAGLANTIGLTARLSARISPGAHSRLRESGSGGLRSRISAIYASC